MRKISALLVITSVAWMLINLFGCKPSNSFDHGQKDSRHHEGIDVPPAAEVNPLLISPAPSSPALPHPVLDNAVPVVFKNDIANFLEPKDFSINQGAYKPARTGNKDNDDNHDYICGNGILEHGEQCDDHNTYDDDACSRLCKITNEDCSFIENSYGSYIHCTDDLNWSDAREACQDFGPFDLASIDSSGENNALEDFIDEDVWIGLNDRDTEGIFEWSNGKSVGYTDWADGEPNNYISDDDDDDDDSNDGEDCGEFYSAGEWNDVHCDNEEQDYLCESNS